MTLASTESLVRLNSPSACERPEGGFDVALKARQIFTAATRGSLNFDALLPVQLLSKVMEANYCTRIHRIANGE